VKLVAVAVAGEVEVVGEVVMQFTVAVVVAAVEIEGGMQAPPWHVLPGQLDRR
jgi:hypothetical protein